MAEGKVELSTLSIASTSFRLDVWEEPNPPSDYDAKSSGSQISQKPEAKEKWAYIEPCQHRDSNSPPCRPIFKYQRYRPPATSTVARLTLHILDLHGSAYHTSDERNPLTAQSHNLLVAAAEPFAQDRDYKGQKHSQ